MDYEPGYHNIQPGQKCRILTIQIAVPADADSSELADEMTGLLTESISSGQSNILDWQYVPGYGPDNANFATASDEPVEGEIFLSEITQNTTGEYFLPSGPHTPGYWQVMADAEKAGMHPFHNWRFVIRSNRGENTIICQMMDSERMAYDARLIAAAPHMKALLRLAYRYLAVMVAENIQICLTPQTVMSRIDQLMAQVEGRDE